MDLDLGVSHGIENILTTVKNTKAFKSVFDFKRQQNIYCILVNFVTFIFRAVWFV
jgi:hypothetical protein